MRKKYKIALLIIGLMIIATFYTGVTYALWVRTFEGNETNVIKAGCFTIGFQEMSKSISLKNTYPIKDSEALQKSKPYKVKISNTCDTTDAGYAITLNTLNVNGTKIDDEKIKVAIGVNNQTPSAGNILKNMEINQETANLELDGTLLTSYIINTGYIEKSTSKTFDLYLWIDSSAGNEVMNQQFEASIVVTSYATKMNTLETAIQTENSARNAGNGIIEVSHSNSELANNNYKNTEYRYVGANPNNYIMFQNETWRIIGLVNTMEGPRIKIIRDQPLRDATILLNEAKNNWTESSLQEYYTNTYLNTLNEESRNVIDTVTWNLGSAIGTLNTLSWYEEEKKENTFGANPNIWSGKIGLISPSDYGYATSGGATIDRNICLNTELSKLSEKSECIANNWLFIANKSQWFLTASLQNGEKYWTINEAGDLEEQNANSAYADRPTLYLKAGLTVKSGNGTPGNPYIIF